MIGRGPMDRRGLLAAGVAVVAGRGARAQPARTRRIAVVHPAFATGELSESGEHAQIAALFVELRRLGYVEARNLTIERYSGEGQPRRYADVAREAVRSAPDVIVTYTNRMILHVAAATSTIPIVGATPDPIALGLVASLARPGGNVTGVVIDAGFELWSKRFEILKELAPAARRVGLLTPSTAMIPSYMPAMRAAAERVGLTLLDAALGDSIDEAEYRRVFEALARLGVECLVVNEAGEHFAHRRVIVALAAAARLPAIYPWREPVLLGGLVAYTYDLSELGRQTARQVDLILRGERPGEIPFYQSDRFELIVNRRAAASLGLTIPPTLLVRADEVIE